MRLPATQRDALALARMSVRALKAWLNKCGELGILMLDAAFEMWAATGQVEPRGKGWRVWLMLAGRGYGKTRAGAEWVHRLAMTGPRQIALVGATIDEARTIMVEGVSGVLSVAARHQVTLKWEPSLGRLTWPTGAVATLFSGERADGLRGPEHDFAWCAGTGRLAAGRIDRQRAAVSAPDESSDRHFLSSRERRERAVRGT